MSRDRLQALREFFYGMTGYEFAQHAIEMRGALETLLILAMFGDVIGVPVLPPWYALRVLPHVAPQMHAWKRRVLREHELGSDPDTDLHGV